MGCPVEVLAVRAVGVGSRGKYWKRLHVLIYPIVVLIVVHLYFVGSALFAAFFVAVVALLAIPRLQRVERWFVSRRKARRQGQC